uniref:Biotin carboxyl carrier protein of acetyl-CoA carboxylase n=1 Tax=Kumanoa americana TaxID=1196377 RepID=A0A1C9CGF4_9FLOR|nr:acetyl-CoA carboxylase biotin carboxyl carrier protein [Kumanoa americana]AOM67442.1 acetyl-CoA carboxylase biotin carboxyl carrier protein [Kumanoa americana]
MNFNIRDLRAFLTCTKNNNLKYISIKKNNFELMINRETVNENLINHHPLFTTKTNNSFQTKYKSKSVIKKQKLSNNNQDTNSKSTTDIYFTIVSPMVGTFYRSPAPNESYFIELYDEVQSNQTVCIIEAMKLMNEIEAEIKGTIIEILVKDGDLVDCGQALMKIKPS